MGTIKFGLLSLLCIISMQSTYAQDMKKKTQRVFLGIVNSHKFEVPAKRFEAKDSLSIADKLKNNIPIQNIAQSYTFVDTQTLSFGFAKEWLAILSENPKIQELKEKEIEKLKSTTYKYYNKIYAEKNEENIVNNIKDMKRVFEKEGTFDVNAINAKKAIIARMVDEWPYLKTKNIVDYFIGNYKRSRLQFYIIYCGESKANITDAYIIPLTNAKKRNDANLEPNHITSITAEDDRSGETKIKYEGYDGKIHYLTSIDSDVKTLQQIDCMLKSNANKTSIKYHAIDIKWELFDRILKCQDETSAVLSNECKNILQKYGYVVNDNNVWRSYYKYTITCHHKNNGSKVTISWCGIDEAEASISIDFSIRQKNHFEQIKDLLASLPENDLTIKYRDSWKISSMTPKQTGRYREYKSFRGSTWVSPAGYDDSSFGMQIAVKKASMW